MATIGRFGKFKFYIKLGKKKFRPEIVSFSNLSWSSSVNVEEHKRYQKKPLLEVVDKNTDEISLEIYLSAYLRQSPMKKYLQLRKCCLQGKAYAFILGGKRIGTKWIITNISNNPTNIYKDGKIVATKVSVTFKEYPVKKKKSKKMKVSSSKKKKKKIGQGTKTSSSKKNEKAKNKKRNRGYTSYTVKKGDTLWGIAKKMYGSGKKYKKIYNANKTESKGFHKISNPSLIYPGWVIKIPK